MVEVLRDPALGAFRVDLQEALDRSARLLLAGWASTAKARARAEKPAPKKSKHAKKKEK
jgi:hypothetical protein